MIQKKMEELKENIKDNQRELMQKEQYLAHLFLVEDQVKEAFRKALKKAKVVKRRTNKLREGENKYFQIKPKISDEQFQKKVMMQQIEGYGDNMKAHLQKIINLECNKRNFFQLQEQYKIMIKEQNQKKVEFMKKQQRIQELRNEKQKLCKVL